MGLDYYPSPRCVNLSPGFSRSAAALLFRPKDLEERIGKTSGKSALYE
jgi:hypothetical protein